MTEPLPDVWTSRDYPVLREITRRIDSGPGMVALSQVAEAIGMDVEQVKLAARALQRRELVVLNPGRVSHAARISGQAYLLTGLHPNGDDAVSRLIDALRQAADQTADEDERGRIRRAADAMGGLSRDVAAAVMTTLITGQIAGA